MRQAVDTEPHFTPCLSSALDTKRRLTPLIQAIYHLQTSLILKQCTIGIGQGSAHIGAATQSNPITRSQF
jgi:hypothetical protein